MSITFKPLVHCIIPPRVITFAGTPEQNVAIVSEYLSASIAKAPFYINIPEKIFRYLSLPFFVMLTVAPISPHKRYRFWVRLFSFTAPTRGLLRMYQSLGLFALFESDDFTKKLGKPIHIDKITKYRAKFGELIGDELSFF